MDWSKIEGCLQHSDKGDVATLACLPAVFQNLLQGLLIFAGVVALFMILFSGIRLIMAGSDAKATDSARQTLIYAILGLVLILLSFLIINIIAYVTHTPCITKFGFSNCQ